jgi:uncharacterized protein YfiM (DUF2279 family)
MEVVARNEYMRGDDRDPTTCSLYYFALGKVKLVQGLWKQAAWHPEQKVMLKFLGNDFGSERWQTAALKNAFALMSKRRFGACRGRVRRSRDLLAAWSWLTCFGSPVDQSTRRPSSCSEAA